MLHKLILFNLLFILTVLAEPNEQLSYLSVRVDKSFHVYINEQLVNQGSFDSLAVISGNYVVHVYDRNNLSWQNRGYTKNVTTEPNQHVIVDFTTATRISISSIPSASQVLLNNEIIGLTPLTLTYPTEAAKQIKLIKEGFEPQRLTLFPGNESYNISLNPISPIANQEVFKAGVEKDQFRWSREGLVITTLATSWLAFFLKREADKNYDKYLRAADPNRLSTYYDRTRVFDRYAEIAVGVSIVSLGTYFYLLLTE
jgi:hypothetical protein